MQGGGDLKMQSRLLTRAEAAESRLLTIDEAAAYCHMKPSGYRKAVRRGVLPGPVPGLRLYDRKAIDLALDRRQGLEQTESSELEKWLAGNEG